MGVHSSMKKNRWIPRILIVTIFCGLLSMSVALAADPGSEKDPLVTLSYLQDTFLQEVMDRVDQKIAERNRQLGGQSGGSGAADTFHVVTLSSGQTLQGAIGCEVMLRVGSAVCVSSSAPGLIDESSASTLNHGGALVQNHLYMMTIEGRGVRASSATTKLLVRGSYTIL